MGIIAQGDIGPGKNLKLLITRRQSANKLMVRVAGFRLQGLEFRVWEFRGAIWHFWFFIAF